MKAIVLLAGMGRRISTKFSGPKSFLKINDETILDRNIRLLRAAGVEDIIGVVGYRENLIKEAHPELRYITNPFYAVTNTLVSLLLGMTLQDYSEDLLIINGDTIYKEDTISKLNDINGSAFAVKELPNFTSEEVKVKINQDGNIVNISKQVESKIEAIGVYKLSPRFAKDTIEIGRNIEDKLFTKAYYEDAFDKFITGYTVKPVYTIAEEVDSWEDYLKARKVFENDMLRGLEYPYGPGDLQKH